MNRRSFLLGAAAGAVVAPAAVVAAKAIVLAAAPLPAWPVHKPGYISFIGQTKPGYEMAGRKLELDGPKAKVFFVRVGDKAASDEAMRYGGGPKIIISIPQPNGASP